MKERRVTLKDIAAEAGVSLMTVSYALRGSKKVSSATRERVKAIAEKMGYHPDPIMKRLSSYRTRLKRSEKGMTLAWIDLYPAESNWKYHGSHVLESFEGARKRALEVGYRLEPLNVSQIGGWERTNKILRARGIEGVIIGQPPAGIHEAKFAWKHFATVAIGRAISSPGLPHVVYNHNEAISLLIERMLDLGYQRIGLVMEYGDCVKNGFRNVAAYYGAAEKFRIPLSMRVPPHLPQQLSEHNLGKWIETGGVEGIIVHRQDQMQQLLPRLGFRVPENIGFAHLSMHTPIPGVSGLTFNPELYGSWAVDLVHWLLEREETGLLDPIPSILISSAKWSEGGTLRRIGSGRENVEGSEPARHYS